MDHHAKPVFDLIDAERDRFAGLLLTCIARGEDFSGFLPSPRRSRSQANKAFSAFARRYDQVNTHTGGAS